MCGSRHPLLRSTVSLLRPQITTRCAQSSSHSLGESWEEDILFQNPLHIVSGMSMCSVKCVVVIVVLLLSVDVGRSWFAGCGRQASLHFPFINSKQHLLGGRSCVCCLATAKVKHSLLKVSVDIICSEPCQEDVTQGCMASAVSPEQLKPHLFFLVGKTHSPPLGNMVQFCS